MAVAKKYRVLGTLIRNHNKGATAAQLEYWHQVGNARSTISNLRDDGWSIDTVQRVDSKGRVKTFYTIDTTPNNAIASLIEAVA